MFLTSTTPIRDRVDQQLAAGAAGQLILLGVLAAGVDLGPLGWLVGTGFAVGLWTLLAGAARRAGSTTLGPADLAGQDREQHDLGRRRRGQLPVDPRG